MPKGIILYFKQLIFQYYKENILIHFISYLLITLASDLFLKFNYCTFVRRYTKPLIYRKANEKLLRQPEA